MKKEIIKIWNKNFIAKFEPINTPVWFEIRQIYKSKKWFMAKPISIIRNMHLLDIIPTFKPLKDCKNRFEYNEQFINYKKENDNK